jgi:hypothetical protein
MEPHERSGLGDLPEGVEIEHDPTIAYLPPEALDIDALASGRIRGAFGYAIIFERGPRAGMAHILADGETRVGRSPESAFFLDDVTVSRHHGRFILSGETLTIEDFGSTNGTYVNGVRQAITELHPGDEIIIGKYHLVVARGDG